MKKWKVFFFFCLVLVLCFTSCRTAETEKIDIESVIRPLFNARPDNTKIELYAGPILSLQEVVSNSAAYLQAWELWQAYAESLEDTLEIIQTRLSE